ncbi:MAG: 8-amino-7-oxononanoate synthase [Nitrospirota bacterium]
MRHLISRASNQGPTITVNNKKFINFSSNDYLGLASQPEIIESAIMAIEKFSFGSGSSRLLAGGCTLHERLEKDVSRFKDTESALVFNSGYSANTGIIPAITFKDDVIFSDEMNHASIIDGCRLSRAKTVLYRHKDVKHLSELMRKEKGKRKIVITDSVFSMDGDIAPLKEIYGICLSHNREPGKRDPAILYIDDAHGTGVLGNGKGALSHFDIRPEPWIIQMGTFSKAMGSFGAFAASGENIIKWISNTARSFIFSTALPPCVIAASIKAIQLIKKENKLIEKLWVNTKRLSEGIKNIGYDTMKSETPIVPIRAGTIRDAMKLSDALFRKGIFAPAIRPPSVREPRIRITVTSAHTAEHIDFLIKTLEDKKRLTG